MKPCGRLYVPAGLEALEHDEIGAGGLCACRLPDVTNLNEHGRSSLVSARNHDVVDPPRERHNAHALLDHDLEAFALVEGQDEIDAEWPIG